MPLMLQTRAALCILEVTTKGTAMTTFDYILAVLTAIVCVATWAGVYKLTRTTRQLKARKIELEAEREQQQEDAYEFRARQIHLKGEVMRAKQTIDALELMHSEIVASYRNGPTGEQAQKMRSLASASSLIRSYVVYIEAGVID